MGRAHRRTGAGPGNIDSTRDEEFDSPHEAQGFGLLVEEGFVPQEIWDDAQEVDGEEVDSYPVDKAEVARPERLTRPRPGEKMGE